MITITGPLPSPISTEKSPAGCAKSSGNSPSFADQLATASHAGSPMGRNITPEAHQESAASILAAPSSSPSADSAAPQDTFLQYLCAAASTPPSLEPATGASAPVGLAPASPTVSGEPKVSADPQETPGYSVASTPPYFTPAPDQYVTVMPSNGMTPFQADSMDSYLQKYIQQSTSDMYGFVSGTQGWANGGASAITNNFVAMVQQRCAAYPSMSSGIDPVAMGTHYANVFMQVLSGVSVSNFGPTNFQGSVLDFLTQGGSPAPTVLNQAPAVLNQPIAFT